MIIQKKYSIIKDINLISNMISKTYQSPFSRICYTLELQNAKYGNQWIMTEFDAFSSDINDYFIPTKLIKRTVNNLFIKSSDGTNIANLDNGHIEFSPFNYEPGENGYDTTDDLRIWENQGNYGCMQVLSGTNVLWAFNRHNDAIHDLGIGNNTGNENKDWTFMANSNDYTFSFNENQLSDSQLLALKDCTLRGKFKITFTDGSSYSWEGTLTIVGQSCASFLKEMMAD